MSLEMTDVQQLTLFQLMERYNIERSSPARERSEEREESREAKSHFDYRHLIPQVSIKTETC